MAVLRTLVTPSELLLEILLKVRTRTACEALELEPAVSGFVRVKLAHLD